MNITVVHFSALVNTGNFSNEKIGLDAQLEPGESVPQAVEALREQVYALLERRDLLEARRELAYEVRELEDKLKAAREDWDRTSSFLRAQGIRPDAPDCPVPGLKRLTTFERVHAEVVEEKVVEDDFPGGTRA